MKLSLELKTSLGQTLTPQQIQYLKMLQLSVVQFEQYIQHELEQNPMLEDANLPDDSDIFDYNNENDADDLPVVDHGFDSYDVIDDNYDSSFRNDEKSDNYHEFETDYKSSHFDEDNEPFSSYSMVWQDTSEMALSNNDNYGDDDDESQFQIKAQTSLEEDLLQQLSLHELLPHERLLGTYIIGNIDNDGYLRRPLNEIVDDTNAFIEETNFNQRHNEYIEKTKEREQSKNPASFYSVSDDSIKLLENAQKLNIEGGSQIHNKNENDAILSKKESNILQNVDILTAEKILAIIQTLEPPGIASRDVRECLISQCKVFINPNDSQKLALKILNEAYDLFIKKHYALIVRQLVITEEDLKAAIEVIKRLNPKPGGGDSISEQNSVIPDFIVERDEDSNELMISLNDSRLPNLKLSKAYELLQKEAKEKNYNKETKNWIRGKREDAKFIIQAIKQRKNTMLKVMTAIATLQKDFFYVGKSGIKPLIYKDVAEETALDISTVCRIVNGKYVQSEFGTYELKFFFSESLISDDGEDISTTVIKEKLKEIIDSENKSKPYSDEVLSKILKDSGFNVARRTVAKYREQLKIPIARLRVEI